MHKNTYLWCQSGFPGLICLLDGCSYTVRGIWDAVRPVTWAFWELILWTLLEGRNLQPTGWLLVRKHDKLLYINVILKRENNLKGPSAETLLCFLENAHSQPRYHVICYQHNYAILDGFNVIFGRFLPRTPLVQGKRMNACISTVWPFNLHRTNQMITKEK